MIPTEDLEEIQEFLVNAIGKIPECGQLGANDSEIRFTIELVLQYIDYELRDRAATEPPGPIHKAIKQEGNE